MQDLPEQREDHDDLTDRPMGDTRNGVLGTSVAVRPDLQRAATEGTVIGKEARRIDAIRRVSAKSVEAARSYETVRLDYDSLDALIGYDGHDLSNSYIDDLIDRMVSLDGQINAPRVAHDEFKRLNLAFASAFVALRACLPTHTNYILQTLLARARPGG